MAQDAGRRGERPDSWSPSGGAHVDEVINFFGLAVRHGLTANDLKSSIFAHPTCASDIGYMI